MGLRRFRVSGSGLCVCGARRLCAVDQDAAHEAHASPGKALEDQLPIYPAGSSRLLPTTLGLQIA